MLFVSLLPTLLLSSKQKFYLLQSPYFHSLPLFFLCHSLSPLKFLLISSPLMTTEFSLQLDKSTLPGHESLLLAYVRFIKDGSLCQELLFARRLETDTKGESVYRTLEYYFQKKKHSTYEQHLMCYRWRPIHGWSPRWISKLFEKSFSESPHISLCDPSTKLSSKESEWVRSYMNSYRLWLL